MATSNPFNVAHTYQNHTIDSTRWNGFERRAGDVIVTTSYKSGTTWTLGILYRLQEVVDGVEPPPMDAWIDARMFPVDLDEQLAELSARPYRRILKSHLAADGMPYWPEVKYVVVGRDARDVFMSLVNHYEQFTDLAYESFNETPGRVGDPLPRYDGDIHKLWEGWMTRGWFDWESEGYPWWGNLHHVATWWEKRHESNVLFVHFNDLKRDLRTEVSRIASFTEFDVTDAQLDQVVEGCSIDAMRNGAIAACDPLAAFFKDGARGFFFKGTNGRWQDVLSAQELELYEAAMKRVMPDDAAEWLENGGSYA